MSALLRQMCVIVHMMVQRESGGLEGFCLIALMRTFDCADLEASAN